MKIGIALGSGAARGWTHIGVLRALEQLGINIDVIAGCSIGAYVGAAYASNKLEPLAEWATGLTEWQVLTLMGIGFRRGGLASGQKVFDLFHQQFCADTFEQMHKPLAVVATDLYSGKEVIFQHGPAKQAIQASCSIPALFPPVKHEDRWLVDGAVVNPVPVNLCRMMGADFVIACNLSADFRPQMLEKNTHDHEVIQQKTDDFFSRSQARLMRWFGSGKKQASKRNVPGMFGVMSSSLDILQARVTRSRLAGEPPDILIEPQLRDVSTMEFHRAEYLIAEGYKSVMRVKDQIKYQLHMDDETSMGETTQPSVHTEQAQALQQQVADGEGI